MRLLYALSGYLGDGRERLTCAQMVPIFGYYFKGGHYPVGGSGRFADVLVEAIEERGGKVHLKTPVSRILVEDGRAAGVVLANGRTVRATAVVSNADMKRTFLELVEPESLPSAFAPASPMPRPPIPPSASIWVSICARYPAGDACPGAGGVGIAMMSKLDPSAAPEGHATLTLISLVPFEEAQAWFPRAAKRGLEGLAPLRRI